MANKIKFGIKTAMYAVASYADGAYTYQTPKSAGKIKTGSFTAQGDTQEVYADDIRQMVLTTNAGYDGSCEVLILSDDFKKDVLGFVDSDGVLCEPANAAQVTFAFLFECSGDESATRYVYWNCTASRPDEAHTGTEKTKSPDTDTLKILASPRENDTYVQGTCPNTVANATKYNAWFTSVWQPAAAGADDGRLESLTLGGLTLAPTFDSNIMYYETTTSSATNTVTVAAKSADATATIYLGDNTITSGNAATWATGDNMLTIQCVDGTDTQTYTVKVTKTA